MPSVVGTVFPVQSKAILSKLLSFTIYPQQKYVPVVAVGKVCEQQQEEEG